VGRFDPGFRPLRVLMAFLVLSLATFGPWAAAKEAASVYLGKGFAFGVGTPRGCIPARSGGVPAAPVLLCGVRPTNTAASTTGIVAYDTQ